MPVYTFRCLKCDKVLKVNHEFSEPHPTNHGMTFVPASKLVSPMEGGPMPYMCSGELVRIFDPPNIIYRGSGWYCKDKVLYDDDWDE